jgi:aerotaxis receptor
VRPQHQPNGREVSLKDDEFIVSKTDPQSRITYANRAFMRITGYSEPEFLGQPQNIIRHPEMPQGVYRLLWNTIRNGDEFLGYINNLCKDGSNYWVWANITPDRDEQGRIVGFFSARRKPDPAAVAKVKPIYAEMLAAEAGASNVDAACKASLAVLDHHIHQEHADYEAFVLSL